MTQTHPAPAGPAPGQTAPNRPNVIVSVFTASSQFAEIGPLVSRILAACAPYLPEKQASEALDTLQICLAEAINNIVEHAYRQQPDQPIEAQLECSDDRITVTLVDQGIPLPDGMLPSGEVAEFDPEDLDSLPEGGWGWMLIIEQLDIVEYRRVGDSNHLRLGVLF